MSLSNKVAQFTADADLAHQVVHGGPTTVVTTEGGQVRSFAKMLADNQATLNSQATLRTDLASQTGAGIVGVSGGGTLQAKLDTMVGQIAGAGAVKTVAGNAPDGSGNVALTTSNVAEGTALFFTEARVRSSLLTGLSTAVSAVASATDSVLSAIGKLQRQVSDLVASKVGLTAGNINFTNAAGAITSFFTNANLAPRTYTFPDKDGTVAMTSDMQSGAMALLGKFTITTGILNLDFLTIFTSAYDTYAIEVQGLTGNNSQGIYVYLAKAGVVDTSSYLLPSADGGGGSSSTALLFGGAIGATASQAGGGVMRIMNANSTTTPKLVSFFGYASTAIAKTGAYTAANAVTGFRIGGAGGLLTGGTVLVYGIKNS